MEIPVYLFTGFLDSGKTKFIQETLEDPRFYDGERTLVLTCEQGEEEYQPSKFPDEHVMFENIDSIDQITLDHLNSLQKKYRMNRVLIEYNGMWMIEKLFDSLPENWQIYQVMTFVDAATFITYNNNMRNLVTDKFTNSEMVIFNRVKESDDIMQFHKIVRASGRSINIAYEYTDGEVKYDEFEDPLPYDINAEVIEINDEDYALFYRDLSEDIKKYENKTVKFKGLFISNPQLPNKSYIVGRHIMTCCVDDISFGGFIMKTNESIEYETRDWVWVCATIKYEFNEVYNSNGPVLYIKDISITLPPKQELATFY